jgi:glutathione S-transferase
MPVQTKFKPEITAMNAMLYFSRNPNPRLAVAVTRHLTSPVQFEWASPFAPGQVEIFRPLNPSLRLPILDCEGGSIWAADAIACQLSQMACSNVWRGGATLPDMIRWIDWAHSKFGHAYDVVHFARGTKQRYRLGPRRRGIGCLRAAHIP